MAKKGNNKIYTIEELKAILTPIFDRAPVYKAILFGSYAKGEADANSDVDIVIDSKGQLRGFKFFGVVGDVEEAVAKPVDVYDVHYLPQNSVVLDAVSQGSVTIYER